METEVRNMQIELANVQRERQQLEQQRKLLKCTAPCAPCACCPPPTSTCVTSTLPGLPLTSISKIPAVSAVPLAQVLTQLVFYTVHCILSKIFQSNTFLNMNFYIHISFQYLTYLLMPIHDIMLFNFFVTKLINSK